MKEHNLWEIFDDVVADWLQSLILPCDVFFFLFLFHVPQRFHSGKFTHKGYNFVWFRLVFCYLFIFLGLFLVGLSCLGFFGWLGLATFILACWRIYFFFWFILIFNDFLDILLIFSLLNTCLLFLKFLLCWFFLKIIGLNLLDLFLFLMVIFIFIF